MFMLRLLSILVSCLLCSAPSRGAEVEYVWKGEAGNAWGNASNWLVGGSAPSVVPGAVASGYTHWMVTNGADSRGITSIGGLGSEGRYLKGIRIAGLNNQVAETPPLFVLNTSDKVYLRVQDGGIAVENTETGGYNADFGIAQLRVAADQTWHVAEGRSFYVGRDDAAPVGGKYSLSSENNEARRVTLTGAGAVRIGQGMMLNHISDLVGFVMNGARGTPTFDLADRGMTNTITVEDAARLEGMKLYAGALIVRENAAVTFSGTAAKASARWNMEAGVSLTLEDSTLDLSEAPVEARVTLKGTSGITGNLGTLKQTLADDAQVTYTDREVKAGELVSVGKNVTITLNNSSIHFDGEIPEVNLVVQGTCTLGGNGRFPGTITYEPGASLSVDGEISLPSLSLTLGSANIATLDGVAQQGSVQPDLPAQQAQEYVVLFDSSLEKMIAAWPGEHTFTVRFKPDMEAAVTVKELPPGVVSWSYDAGGKVLTLKTNVAAVPEMPAGVSGAKPNIIFVLVDDMGWGDMSVNWTRQDKNGRTVTRAHSFETPTLDTMAAEGMQLRRHYSAAPVCAPARASLLLGVHQGHSRVVRNNSFDCPIENSHTLGTLLKGAGYHTAAIGKWGVGGAGQSGKALTAAPHMRGFDYFYGIINHMAGHYHYLTEGTGGVQDIYEYDDRAVAPAWTNVKAQVPGTAYDTDLFGARAKQWIMDHHEKAVDQPFFLYLAFPAPHGCLSAPACAYPAGLGKTGGLQWEKKGEYEASNTAAAGWSGVAGDFGADTYIYPEHEAFGKTESRHATMIRRVDDVLKDMIQLLKDLGMDDNTMIVFTSDNGPHNEAGGGNFKNGTQDPSYFKSYGMMDGIKRDCWEGGMRVPTVVRWPGRIATNGISLHASQFQDWMATFADVAGVPVPSRCDGVSLLPTLVGVPERQKNSAIYTEYAHSGNTPTNADFLPEHRGRGHDQQQIVFVDGFKGVRMGKATPAADFEIYDTEKDPQESVNLASSRPDLQEKMKAQALRMRRPSPVNATNFDSAYVQPVNAPSGLRQGGLRWRAWSRGFDWVPDFRQLEEAPAATGATGSLNVLNVNAGPAGRKGVELSGYLTVPTTGEYKFYLRTDANAGSKAFVHLHDMQLIDADYAYTPGAEAVSNGREGVSSDVQPNAVQTVRLTAGVHPIRIGYVGNTASSSVALQWESAGAGISKGAVPASAFSYEYVNPVNIDKTEETVESGAVHTALTVQTQLPWTAASDQPWATVHPASGTGTAVLDIAVEANSAETGRTAVVTVTCDGEQRTLTLTQNGAPPLTGYDKWKKDKFPAETPEDDRAPGASPAGDGIPNLMKYATGLDPVKPCGSVTTLTVRDKDGMNYLVLGWPVNPDAVDVIFSVESSPDLETWTQEATVVPTGAHAEYEDTAAMDETAPQRRFLRLNVTRGADNP